MNPLEIQANAILEASGWPDDVLTARQLRYITEEREVLCAEPDPGRAGIYGRTHVSKGMKNNG